MFVGNQEPTYEKIVQNVLTNFKIIRANICNKLDLIRNHREKSSDN